MWPGGATAAAGRSHGLQGEETRNHEYDHRVGACQKSDEEWSGKRGQLWCPWIPQHWVVCLCLSVSPI